VYFAGSCKSTSTGLQNRVPTTLLPLGTVLSSTWTLVWSWLTEGVHDCWPSTPTVMEMRWCFIKND
jgi:hypothetical protein